MPEPEVTARPRARRPVMALVLTLVFLCAGACAGLGVVSALGSILFLP